MLANKCEPMRYPQQQKLMDMVSVHKHMCVISVRPRIFAALKSE